ncbi:MAG: DUF3990 domain-containing protein [Lachnospiraceae bacterium]|nr:DUF3990 domain-containing protein [Lachnospiraceae bacterium]
MMLFHGSHLTVEKPEISFSRENVDFGRGFYTTPIKEQAVRWSERFKRKHGQSIVTTYELDELILKKDIKILEFKAYSDEWFDFIVKCRSGVLIDGYDVVIGGVANDKVFDTIQLYFDGLISKSESIKKLRYEKPNIQYCFKNQAIIDEYLHFISSEVYQ